MKQIVIFLSLLFIFTLDVNAQEKIICGNVVDSNTNKPLANVNVWIENTVIGATSDINGDFCLNIENINNGIINISFSLISYKKQTKKVSLKEDKKLSISLEMTSVSLSEIIVTTSKNVNSFQEQSVISELISKKAIVESGILNISDILIKQPGVSLVGTGYHTAPSLRGLARKRIVVMVDGEKVSSERNVGAPGTYVNPFEIEKIEILKGPYSTLYGSDAVGGVVNIILKDYDYPVYNEKIGGRLDMSYKSISNGKNTNLSVNGKLDKLQYRISSGYRDADNYRDANNNEVINTFFKEKHVAGKLKYSFNSDNELSFKTYYSKGGPIGFPAYSTLVDAVHDYDDHFVVGLNYKANNIGKYLKKTELNVTRHSHELGADINVHKVEQNPNDDKLVKMRKDLNGVDYITQFDMYFTINKKFKILAGFDGYFRENIDVVAHKKVYNYNIGDFIMEVDDVSLSDASQRSYGLFTQVDYSISDKLNANAGIRWNYITTQQPDNPDEDKNNSAVSGNLGISYSLSKKLSVKANIGSAFRTPDIKELYVTTQTPEGMNIGNPNLVPEQSINLDFAIIYQGNNNMIQLSTFRNQISDMIIIDWDYSTNPRTGTYKNIGEGLLYGVEFSYEQRINKQFSGFLNLTQIYGYDTNADDELMDVPPFELNIGAKYNYNNKLNLSLSARYSAQQNNVAEDDFENDAFVVVDFSASYLVTQNLNFNLSISNLLNEDYREHYQFEWIRSPGRSINLGMNFNF